MSTLEKSEIKLSKMVIISEMIDYLTDNEIVIAASNKALAVTEHDLIAKNIVNKKFTEMVFDLLPSAPADHDDDFFVDVDSKESEAISELIRVQTIIDRATSAELDVRCVGQVYK